MPENAIDLPHSLPLMAIETDAGQPACARINGIAVHTIEGGVAHCARDGVAYCPNSGNATSLAGGVAYVRPSGNGGHSSANTGDGGVSVAKGYNAEASCEGWGVAFVRSESYSDRGRVKGGPNSILVISWNDPSCPVTPVRSIQVGSSDPHGTTICPGVWYTLDADDSTKWVRV